MSLNNKISAHSMYT